MVFMAIVTIVATARRPALPRPAAFRFSARAGETLELSKRFLHDRHSLDAADGVSASARPVSCAAPATRAALCMSPCSAPSPRRSSIRSLIFWLDLGLDGAAISTVLSRIVMLAVGGYGAAFVHHLLAFPTRARLQGRDKAVLRHRRSRSPTQLATPVGNAYCDGRTGAFRRRCRGGHGSRLAGLVPVAFVALFARPGAIGPILAQNLGARRFDRLRSAMRDALLFSGDLCA